jgi:hypothetical protein
MKTIARISDWEVIELNYKVAYYVAQNAIAEGASPSTIRSNTLKAEEFERASKNRPSDPVHLAAINRVAKWIGIEDAIAGRPENPQVDDFGEIAPCLYESPVGPEERLSLAGEDDNSGTPCSIC